MSSPASGPCSSATATARLSSTTDEPVRWASRRRGRRSGASRAARRHAGRDRHLQHVDPVAVQGQGPVEHRPPVGDLRGVPERAVLVGEQHQVRTCPRGSRLLSWGPGFGTRSESRCWPDAWVLQPRSSRGIGAIAKPTKSYGLRFPLVPREPGSRLPSPGRAAERQPAVRWLCTSWKWISGGFGMPTSAE